MDGNMILPYESATDVRALRERLSLDQATFAQRFGLSLRTVQQWEQRRRVPDGPAQVLLQIIDRESSAAEGALLGPQDYEMFRQRIEDVRKLVDAENLGVIFAERNKDIPTWRVGDDRLATMAFDFWPMTSRSSILVAGKENLWFDILDPVALIARAVISGLFGPEPSFPMTFSTFASRAEHAMISIVAGRAEIRKISKDLRSSPAVKFSGGNETLSMSAVDENRIEVRNASRTISVDYFPSSASAVQCGAYMASVFVPQRRR